MSPLKVLTGRGVVPFLTPEWSFTTHSMLQFKVVHFTIQKVKLFHCQEFQEICPLTIVSLLTTNTTKVMEQLFTIHLAMNTCSAHLVINNCDFTSNGPAKSIVYIDNLLNQALNHMIFFY